MQLDVAFVKRVSNAMHTTWQQIGYDIMQCCDEFGEALDNEMAIESCIDANRLWLNGNDKAADELVLSACVEHGYDKTLKFLCKHFNFA